MTTSDSTIISFVPSRQEFPTPPTSGINIICKFVVINNAASSKLVFGPVSEFPYHAGLVKRFCDEHEIAAGWAKKPDLYAIYDSSYRINGGGWLGYQEQQQLIRIFGQSTAYGRFEPDTVKRLFSADSVFTRFTIVIED